MSAYVDAGRDDWRHETKVLSMQDLFWLAVICGLFTATLAYARLCDEA